jgi:hypothetical protein
MDNLDIDSSVELAKVCVREAYRPHLASVSLCENDANHQMTSAAALKCRSTLLHYVRSVTRRSVSHSQARHRHCASLRPCVLCMSMVIPSLPVLVSRARRIACWKEKRSKKETEWIRKGMEKAKDEHRKVNDRSEKRKMTMVRLADGANRCLFVWMAAK